MSTAAEVEAVARALHPGSWWDDPIDLGAARKQRPAYLLEAELLLEVARAAREAEPVTVSANRPLNPACEICRGRATLIVDPIGDYDTLAWDETYACERHVGGLLVSLAEQLEEVRVTLVRVPVPAAPGE